MTIVTTDRALPWYGLTVPAPEGASTTELLHTAGLADWDVRVEPVDLPDNYWAAVDQYRVVRNSPVVPGNVDILGYVKERYVPFQNEELFAIGDAIPDSHWDSLGFYANGTRVFGMKQLDRTTVLDPGGAADTVSHYLAVVTSHDGTVSIMAAETPIRLACTNMIGAAIRNASRTFKIRHTKTMQERVNEARNALAQSHAYIDRFEQEMQALIETEITNLQFEQMIEAAYAPKTDSKAALTRYDKRHEALWDLYTGPTVENVNGTAYGAWQAFNEERLWLRNGRGDNSLENEAAARSGFNAVVNSDSDTLLSVVRSFA